MIDWNVVSFAGSQKVWFLVGVLLIFSELLNRKLTWKSLIAPLVLVSEGIAQLLKLVFKVPRPCSLIASCPTSYAFPSGHTTVAFAVATFIAIKGRNRLIGVTLLLYAVLVSASRIFLGYHTVYDVLGGFALGTFLGFLATKFCKIVGSKTTKRNFPIKISGC